MVEENNAPAQPGNPLANLDQDTQQKIQELQMMEQSFQQLMMQKNAFSMEQNETDFIIKEVEFVLEKMSVVNLWNFSWFLFIFVAKIHPNRVVRSKTCQ